MTIDRSTTAGSWIIWGLLLAVVACKFSSAADAPATKARDGSDMVCGPRCVRFLLNRYGRDVELVDLVKEIQWPDLEAGASLEQIQKCLNSRGIHTSAIRIAPDRRLRWPHPAILHIVAGDSPMGHYVVQVPGETPSSDALIWAGLEGWRRGRWEEVTRGFSGVALLTSPEPITDVGSSIGPVPMSRLVWVAALATAVALLAHVSYRLATRRRLGTGVPSR